MNTVDKIRHHYPLPITKLYTAVHFETDPRLQVQKLVELFEGTIRHLSLIGLAAYTQFELVEPNIEFLRPGLEKPSLGHWVNLLKATAPSLEPHGLNLLGASPDQNHNSDLIGEITRQFAQILDRSTKIRRVKLTHFLEAVVEFRNKKFGHGTLSRLQAREVFQPFQDALLLWLEELTILKQQKLVYIAHVEWQNSQFVYRGIDLNSGDSPLSFTVQGSKGIFNNRIYLYHPEREEFLLLYPFFVFDDDRRLLYVYHELSSQEKLLLRCPYEVPGAETPYSLDVDKTIVVGIRQREFDTTIKNKESEPKQETTQDEKKRQPAAVSVQTEAKIDPTEQTPKITFDSLVQQLENRILQICRLPRYRVLWIIGKPCSGKTSVARAVCQQAGWQYVNFTLDPNHLDGIIGQEETYRPGDFLKYLHTLCQSSREEVIVLDEIEPILGWWPRDEQEVFFRTIGRATRLDSTIVLVTRARNAQQLDNIVPGKDHIFEISGGVEL